MDFPFANAIPWCLQRRTGQAGLNAMTGTRWSDDPVGSGTDGFAANRRVSRRSFTCDRHSDHLCRLELVASIRVVYT